MRMVVQRVARASVTVNNTVVAEIGRGLCVLVGITADDDASAVEYMVRKILSTRLWPNAGPDAEGKAWTRSVVQEDLQILCVSQFTLYVPYTARWFITTTCSLAVGASLLVLA